MIYQIHVSARSLTALMKPRPSSLVARHPDGPHRRRTRRGWMPRDASWTRLFLRNPFCGFISARKLGSASAGFLSFPCPNAQLALSSHCTPSQLISLNLPSRPLAMPPDTTHSAPIPLTHHHPILCMSGTTTTRSC